VAAQAADGRSVDAAARRRGAPRQDRCDHGGAGRSRLARAHGGRGPGRGARPRAVLQGARPVPQRMDAGRSRLGGARLRLGPARRPGGLLAAGSDAANQLLVPGLSLHEEIALLVAAGFTAVEAITAATRKGAQLLHADSLGLLGAGKVADLVVLDGDPVTTIAATR